MRRAIREILAAYWRRNWPLVLTSLAVFALGMGFGVLGARNLPDGQLEELKIYVDSFLQQATLISIDPAGAAQSKICEDIIVMGLLYVFGLTFIGIPFILVLVFIRGFILSFAVAFLVRGASLKGSLLLIISMLPHNILYLPALLVGSAAALSFALLSVRRYNNTRIRLLNCLVGYTLVMAAVTAVVLGAGMAEVYLSPWLVKTVAGFIKTVALR